MKYYRVFSDSMGESHIDEIIVEQPQISQRGVMMTLNYPAISYNFMTFPAGWDRGWHVAPIRQFAVQVSGVFEAEASDGKKVELGPGSILLTEDMTGKGHRSRNISEREAEVLFIQI